MILALLYSIEQQWTQAKKHAQKAKELGFTGFADEILDEIQQHIGSDSTPNGQKLSIRKKADNDPKKLTGDQKSESPKEIYDRAIAFGQDGKFVEARDLLRTALTASPGNPSIISCLTFAEDGAAERISIDLGKLLFSSTISGNRGDWNTALSLAQEASKVGPKYAPAHLHLGVVYIKLVGLGRGDYYVQDAIGAYKEAIHINPDYTQAHYNLGVAYAVTRQWKIARAELQLAKELAQVQKDSTYISLCDRMLSQIVGRK